MVIIFYDANEEKYYICSESDKTKVVSANDPNLMDYVPNDDIFWVEDAHCITKKQFGDWMRGDLTFTDDNDTEVSKFKGFLDDGPGKKRSVPSFMKSDEPQLTSKYYIHPVHNGTIMLQDIKTEKYPAGVQLNGKWHFVAIDDIGEEVLEESMHFKTLLGKGKIEVVDADYVKKNIHKQKQKTSPSEAALNAILVPADIKAHAAASSGGVSSSGDEIPEILVEG